MATPSAGREGAARSARGGRAPRTHCIVRFRGLLVIDFHIERRSKAVLAVAAVCDRQTYRNSLSRTRIGRTVVLFAVPPLGPFNRRPAIRRVLMVTSSALAADPPAKGFVLAVSPVQAREDAPAMSGIIGLLHVCRVSALEATQRKPSGSAGARTEKANLFRIRQEAIHFLQPQGLAGVRRPAHQSKQGIAPTPRDHRRADGTAVP
jgi:hypothetical protein